MNRIDSMIISSLRDIGLNIPEEIQSIEDMDRVFFFNLCINCLGIVDPSVYDMVQQVGDELDLSHSACVLLVEQFMRMGYSYDLSFSVFMYPEPDDIVQILTWLISLISNIKDQTSRGSTESVVIENELLINSIKEWREKEPEEKPKQPISSFVSSLIEEENYQIIREDMHYIWNNIALEEIQQLFTDPSIRQHVHLKHIHCSTNPSESTSIESLTHLQSELVQFNQLVYRYKKNNKNLEKNIHSIEKSIEEIKLMVQQLEQNVFEKQQEQNIIQNIDLYLKRVHESCDLISSETTKEEMIYTNKKEMIKEELDQLENKKQLYWEKSQSLLSQIQEDRQEIEGITAIVGEKKREKEELDEMVKCMPQQAFREVYTNRLFALSTRRKEQQDAIDHLTEEVHSLNEVIHTKYQEVQQKEKEIEKKMRLIYGNETEIVSLYNDYSQMKRLFGTLMTIIHQIIECNDEIAKITIQLNQINVTVVCKNNDLLVKDVKRLQQENASLLQKLKRLESR